MLRTTIPAQGCMRTNVQTPGPRISDTPVHVECAPHKNRLRPKEVRSPFPTSVRYHSPACTRRCSPLFPTFRECHSQGVGYNTTYEHVNRVCGERLENPKVLNSNEILRIPSAVESTTPQITIGNVEPCNLRRIQHVSMPDEPHIQWRIMKDVVWLEKRRQLRNPAMEPTKPKFSERGNTKVT